MLDSPACPGSQGVDQANHLSPVTILSPLAILVVSPSCLPMLVQHPNRQVSIEPLSMLHPDICVLEFKFSGCISRYRSRRNRSMEKGPGEWYIRTVGIGGIEPCLCLFPLLKQPAHFKRSHHPAHLNLTGYGPCRCIRQRQTLLVSCKNLSIKFLILTHSTLSS